MNDKATKPDHVYLIDGSGFLFRAYFARMQTRLARSDGTPTNAAFIFTQMMMKVIEDMDAEYVAVVFDKGRYTFRNKVYPEYKAHRPDPPEDLIPQFEMVRDAVRALNVACVELEGFEADDLIATYARVAREAGHEVTIVSSDKDLMQLVRDGVVMWDAVSNQTIGPAEVERKFGVAPEKVIDVQALCGDATDNVPGVAGIGLKTAAQLIQEYGDLDTLLSRAQEIKQPKRRESLIAQADMARLSRRLVTLRDDVPLPVPLEDLAVKAPDPATLIAYLEKQEFKSLLAKAKSRTAAAGAALEPVAKAPIPLQAAYELVLAPEALKRWVADARAAGIVAVDTETTSLNSMRADLVGISLSVDPGRACYIPVGHTGAASQGALALGDAERPAPGDAPKQMPKEAALELLRPLLADAGVLKIGHNIKYDMQVLARSGVAVTPIDDTMLLSYVLEGGLHGHGMDELATLHLGHTTIKYKDVTRLGKTQVTFDAVPLEAARDYAAEDADVTLRLWHHLKPRLAREHMVSVYETLERPLIAVLETMERTGITVDASTLKALSADFAKRLAELERDIHKLAGREFNVGSPKQLGEVLFDEMRLDGGKKAKTGAYVTSADVLEELAAQGHDLPARVLEWRQLAKLKSTYTDTLVGQIHPLTGRVHTCYSQAVASTGRLSSNDPNLQNIPVRTEEGRKIRQAFVAEKGWRLLSADYSQIELRLLAHVAGIEALKEAFRAGQDIHAMTAAQVFGVPIAGMDPMVRRQAKAINFGIIYGISAFGLARQLGIARSEAARYIEAYLKRYPGIRDYTERTKQEAREKGFVTTSFGRKCFLAGINDKNPSMKSFAERAAVNAPLQGGAADIIKRAMVRVPDALKEAGLRARMLLQVHDELVFEVPQKEAEATAKLVKAVMERAADLSVPVVVDTGVGANWDEAH